MTESHITYKVLVGIRIAVSDLQNYAFRDVYYECEIPVDPVYMLFIVFVEAFDSINMEFMWAAWSAYNPSRLISLGGWLWL